MRALVQEATQNFTIPPEGGSVTIGIKDVRPRLEGYEGALRGPALSAQLADRAQYVFLIRPLAATTPLALAALTSLQSLLTIQTLPLLGGDEHSFAGVPTTSYPYINTDVSGQLLLFRGRLVFDVQDFGVCRASLELVNWSADPITALVSTQIFADVRIPQWERERLGEEDA